MEGEPEFIQVTWTVDDSKVFDREVRSMSKLKGHKRTLITMDTEPPELPEGIEFVNAVDFFMS